MATDRNHLIWLALPAFLLPTGCTDWNWRGTGRDWLQSICRERAQCRDGRFERPEDGARASIPARSPQP